MMKFKEDIIMKIKKYRKKPVVIEAYQTDKVMYIETLEGRMKANVGDYIITGINGEQYPCKPDIFEKTYELVDVVEDNEPQYINENEDVFFPSLLITNHITDTVKFVALLGFILFLTIHYNQFGFLWLLLMLLFFI